MMKSSFLTYDEVCKLIHSNAVLVISAHEDALEKLPKGNWVGGSTHYFIIDEGGTFSSDKYFVNNFSPVTEAFEIKQYDKDSIKDIGTNAFGNSVNILIIPALSNVLEEFAVNSLLYKDILKNPLVGFCSFKILNKRTKVTPRFDNRTQYIDGMSKGGLKFNGLAKNGLTQESYESKAICLHIKLKENLSAKVDIVNIFAGQVSEDRIEILDDGFKVKKALINGEQMYLYDYLSKDKSRFDTPMITNFGGAKINCSFMSINDETKEIILARPVRKEEVYRISEVKSNHVELLNKNIPDQIENVFYSCNCILNYFQGNLSGESLKLNSPATFGEIGYTLLNQTVVYLNIEKKE